MVEILANAVISLCRSRNDSDSLRVSSDHDGCCGAGLAAMAPTIVSKMKLVPRMVQFSTGISFSPYMS